MYSIKNTSTIKMISSTWRNLHPFKHKVILLGVLFLVLLLQSCWMSPGSLNEFQSVADDSSVNTSLSIQDNYIFNDFISSVYQAPADEKQALVDSFMQWADTTTGIPYIEGTTAYFFYINGSNPSVSVAGDFTGWDPENQQLSHLLGTNLYFRGYPFESDARLDYKLVINSTWILDPLNPRTTSGGYGPNSELAMPDYVQPWEIQSLAIPHGTVSYHTFSDTTQGRSRSVRVYTPPGYTDSTADYRCIYFLDGNEYLSLGSAQNILDYLIFNELIPPVIGVFTDPVNRDEEYDYDMAFMEMFVNELVPWIDSSYRTNPGAENRAIVGVSLGGLTSLLFTLHHPETFGNCGAYSSAVWLGDLIQQYQASDVLPVKIYMDVGTYESSIYNSSLTLQEELADQGWDHQWRVWHEGHSWGAWRAHLDESLLYFWPLTTTGIDDSY